MPLLIKDRGRGGEGDGVFGHSKREIRGVGSLNIGTVELLGRSKIGRPHVKHACMHVHACKDGGQGEDHMIGWQGEGERETNDLFW